MRGRGTTAGQVVERVVGVRDGGGKLERAEDFAQFLRGVDEGRHGRIVGRTRGLVDLLGTTSRQLLRNRIFSSSLSLRARPSESKTALLL